MKNNNVIVLVACMHQTDYSIIERINIQTDAVVINQCDRNEFKIIYHINKKGEEKTIKFISTTERGLSNSRNMAIKNVDKKGGICLLCDEDEVLSDNYEDMIIEGYAYHQNADIVAFSVNWSGFGKKYPFHPYVANYIQTLKICSVQISFNYTSIAGDSIFFDEKMGSGTGNGAGEENKFLMDCRRHKKKIAYYPNVIALVADSESKWFSGFDGKYFENFGWSSRRIHSNLILSFLYIVYYAIKKKKLYANDSTFFFAMYHMCKGLFLKR